MSDFTAWRRWRIDHEPESPPWPRERAEIARRHAAATDEMRRYAIQQYASGRSHGCSEALERIADAYGRNFDWQRHVYEGAMYELAKKSGQALGQTIARSVDPYRVELSASDKIQRMALDSAMVSAKLRPRGISDEMMTILTIEIAPTPCVNFALRIPDFAPTQQS
jgi:hypothetical protein